VRGRTTSTSKLRVRYAETDQMGVVYHTHYLVWCEIGRTDFIRQLGMTYAALERDGLFLAVAEANVRYGGSARYDDAIRVDTWIENVQSRALTFGYRITREDDDGGAARLATATTKLIALDGRGAPRALPPPLLGRFRALLEADPD
jgi:acyl-CoA thioester hydrolase